MHPINLFGSILLTLWALPSIAAFSQTSRTKPGGEKWAILIGIDDYLNAGDLKYCGADQRSLKEQLVRSGFNEAQVYLLHDEAKDRKLTPYKTNIERQLKTVLGFAERGDFILLAFSGHGVHFNKVSYLCPGDAKLDDPSTLISMDWVYEQLGKSKADLRLVMVDACRNDPRPEGQRSMSPKELREGTRQFVETSDQRLPEGIVLLHSCSEGEVSQEDKDFGHGVFMHYILEGLAGSADQDGDQVVTFNELVRYSSRETKIFVEKRYNDSQRPKLKGNLAGDVLDFGLASLRAASARPPAIPNVPRQPAFEVESLVTNSLGLQLKLIPKGTFLMGSTETKADLKRMGISLYDTLDISDEQPQHKVEISRDFYMSAYEVTLSQFLQYYNADKIRHKTDAEKDGKGGWGYDGNNFEQKPNYVAWNTGWNQPVEQYMNHPVVNVSWNDAVSFCEWLTTTERTSSRIKRDQAYTLPTEAQWEYACRGGSTQSTLFSFGNNAEDFVRNGNVLDAEYAKKAPNFPYGDPIRGNDGYVFTAPVGKYRANGFGLYDMHGNVFEWCLDVYDSKAYASRSGVTKDPVASTGGSYRVYRGGSWRGAPVHCRSASRRRGSPEFRINYLGFRVVLQSVR